MIIAEDMQDAVDQQLIKAAFHRHFCVGGFPCAGIRRNHHVSKQEGIDSPVFSFLHGKRDDVGGAGMVQVRLIEFLDARIIHDQDGEFAIMAVQGV